MAIELKELRQEGSCRQSEISHPVKAVEPEPAITMLDDGEPMPAVAHEPGTRVGEKAVRDRRPDGVRLARHIQPVTGRSNHRRLEESIPLVEDILARHTPFEGNLVGILEHVSQRVLEREVEVAEDKAQRQVGALGHHLAATRLTPRRPARPTGGGSWRSGSARARSRW